MQYSLATIREGQSTTPVIEVSGRYWRLRDLDGGERIGDPRAGLMGLFADWAASEAWLGETAGRLARGEGPAPLAAAPASADFLAPLLYPRKVMAIGYNYADHVKEGGLSSIDKDNVAPTFFFKPPTTSVVGCGKTVRYTTQSSKLDWEIELALVIGRTARKVSVAEAPAHIAAYTVGIDLSLRDLQANPRHPRQWDLFCGKAFDDGCPLGPKLVPSRFVDPANVGLRLWVNDDLKQDSNSGLMIWNVAEQISLLSQHVTLEPGDVLLTGTPPGIGRTTNTYLRPGDRIDAEASGIGRLSVEIIEP